ncbi:Translation initiation factor IF-3-like protein [Leptotrombidium deliense]|uniref:Translation initiation factor IF-3-like protein n=1 Tax=Leptotrombidium deliense TaxID=299467 RepID=A0A443SH83_9ACAR|nr:Translation initiation factor IF-3-like protein [Leptotrombidium deliense]
MNSRLSCIISSLTKCQYLRGQQAIPLLLVSEVGFSSKPISKKESDIKKIVYLVDDNGKHLGTKSISEAETIAHKLKMILVCLDTTTKYPTYKLKSKSEVDESVRDSHKSQKANTKLVEKHIKNLVLTTKISDHDLAIKVDAVKKWLKSCDKINIVVTGDKNNFDNLYSKFSVLTKDYATLKQKQIGTNLKFICTPNVAVSTVQNDSTKAMKNKTEVDNNSEEEIDEELKKLLNTKGTSNK